MRKGYFLRLTIVSGLFWENGNDRSYTERRQSGCLLLRAVQRKSLHIKNYMRVRVLDYGSVSAVRDMD